MSDYNPYDDLTIPRPPAGDDSRWAPAPEVVDAVPGQPDDHDVSATTASFSDPYAAPAAAPPAVNQQGAHLGYAVDLVFVIDITGSMKPVLDQVKAGALGFHDHLLRVMGAKDKHVSSLRLRVVAYRDYLDNAADGLFHTPFMSLPEEAHLFSNYVAGLHPDGGGDEPESGLEGLAVACLSDWERGLDRRRHVVVLFTDASAHSLEAARARAVPGYPTGLPATFDELTDLWDDPQGAVMEFAAKRLLLYAPDVYPWNVISANWDNVLHFPSRAGAGLNEVQFGQIVDAIAGSV